MTLAIAAVLLLPQLLIKDSAQMMTLYIFKQAIPMFLVMLVAFSALKLIHNKLGLVNLNH